MEKENPRKRHDGSAAVWCGSRTRSVVGLGCYVALVAMASRASLFGVGLARVPKHSGAPVALLQRGMSRRQVKGWVRLQILKQGIYEL